MNQMIERVNFRFRVRWQERESGVEEMVKEKFLAQVGQAAGKVCNEMT